MNNECMENSNVNKTPNFDVHSKRRGLSKFALILCTPLDGSCLTTPKDQI